MELKKVLGLRGLVKRAPDSENTCCKSVFNPTLNFKPIHSVGDQILKKSLLKFMVPIALLETLRS